MFLYKMNIDIKNIIIDNICDILKLNNIKLSTLKPSSIVLIPEYNKQ